MCLPISLKTGALNEPSQRCRQFIFFPPCRTHFAITNSTARIGCTFDRRPFACVQQNLRSFWIFSAQGKRGHWAKFRRRLCPSSWPVGITCSRRRSRESYRMCVLFSGFLLCVGFCRKISVRSCRKSVYPKMQLSRRFGITNSSSDFSERSIAVLRKGNEITQAKTGTALSLPLTNEVGEALIDYLKSGRPQTTHREVFLKVKPPFDPFTGNNLHHIVTYWRLLAGITFRSPQKRGIHSLRHTLATRLLENGTPFTTIAEILGHTNLESTRIYAKADVEALRGVALDPEEVNHAN